MILVLRRAAAFAVVIVAALLVPSLATAAEFEVNGTGDSAEPPAKAACETGVGECTLRAAIADAGANSELDEVTFGPTFDGGSGSTIALGSTLSISQPIEIRDSLTEISGKLVPAATVQISGLAFSISAAETVIEGLGIESSAGGIRILGALGDEIRNNFISGVQGNSVQVGVEVNPGQEIVGNLIEGNRILVPGYSSWGVAIQSGANQIFGNEIVGGGEGIPSSGCCYQGIDLNLYAAGNQIGGDTAESENVITGFWYGAIWDQSGHHNEIGRNRGIITADNFIFAGSAPTPTISKAYPTKVTGTAEPGAKVRVFATVGEYNGEIEGFLGDATAEPDGTWTVPITTAAVGSYVTATQTVEGGTSQMSATVAVEAEPSSGGGGGGGGSSPSGGSSGATTSTTSTAAVPKVTITKGPAKKSKATTAKFKFKASIAGAKLECKLDKAKWAKCASPKTYKRLKPGVHTFQVRATASALTGPTAKFKFTVKP